MTVREIASADRDWVAEIVTQHFASPRVVSRGELYDARVLPGFIVERHGAAAGLYQYHAVGRELQLVVVAAVQPGQGVGRRLLQHAVSFAKHRQYQRIWLVTTNNNTRAIGFYRHLGWNQCAVHVDAVTTARAIKPEIPLTDDAGEPIRDEIEFEFHLT